MAGLAAHLDQHIERHDEEAPEHAEREEVEKHAPDARRGKQAAERERRTDRRGGWRGEEEIDPEQRQPDRPERHQPDFHVFAG